MKKTFILIYVGNEQNNKLIRRCNGELIHFLPQENEQNLSEKAILFISEQFGIFSIQPYALQILEIESIEIPFSQKFNKYRRSQTKMVIKFLEKIEKEDCIYLKFFIETNLDNLILIEVDNYFIELCDPKEINLN